MKLSDLAKVRNLIVERANAARVLGNIDDADADIGPDADVVTVKVGTPAHSAVKEGLRLHITAIDERLKAAGVEVDLAVDDAGVTDEDKGEEGGEE
jgi:hypothetical protein